MHFIREFIPHLLRALTPEYTPLCLCVCVRFSLLKQTGRKLHGQCPGCIGEESKKGFISVHCLILRNGPVTPPFVFWSRKWSVQRCAMGQEQMGRGRNKNAATIFRPLRHPGKPHDFGVACGRLWESSDDLQTLRVPVRAEWMPMCAAREIDQFQ